MFTTTTFLAALFLFAAQGQANQFNKTRVSQSIASATKTAITASQTAAILNATVANCFLTLPANPLTAAGLSTPFLLQPPCSMTVGTQQAFAEAAIFDPATGAISIYHPLVSDANVKPAVAPVVPALPAGAVVALWFGFNGGVLSLLDTNGKDTNNSPILKGVDCVNGLPGVQNDVFGQVSWCNAQAWFAAANAGVASGKTVIPDLGVDTLGNACPTSRSFEITDACPSDNVPTQYILLPDGATAQDTAANNAAFKNGTVINNASDEALLTNILDPLIGCTAFLAPSLTNPGAMVPALALSELQASAKQAAPIGLVPINDPDCLTTADGAVSLAKTNAYRLGVNQPVITAGSTDGALVPYCQGMVAVQPPFLKGFQTILSNTASPDTGVGNNLFTFLANRYLMSLQQLVCPPSAIPFQPVVCKLDGNGAATSCVITLAATTSSSVKAVSATSSKATSASSIKATSSAASVIVSKPSSVALVSAKVNSTIASSVKSTSVISAAAIVTSSSAIKLVTSSPKASSSSVIKATSTSILATSSIAKILTTAASKTSLALSSSAIKLANSTISAKLVTASSSKTSLALTSSAVKLANSTISAKLVTATSSKPLSTSAVKFTNSTVTAKALTTPSPTKSTSALATSSKPATTSKLTTTTTTIIVEIITFFIFPLSLGSTPPPVLSGNTGGTFIVLEEIFINLPAAASAACTHQFNACAALAGTAFSGSDCLVQLNACTGVASTASATATTPGTMTATQTVPAATGSTVGAAALVTGGGAGSCPVTKPLTISACTATATVTVTVSKSLGTAGTIGVAKATGTTAPRHLHLGRHVKGRALGKY